MTTGDVQVLKMTSKKMSSKSLSAAAQTKQVKVQQPNKKGKGPIVAVNKNQKKSVSVSESEEEESSFFQDSEDEEMDFSEEEDSELEDSDGAEDDSEEEEEFTDSDSEEVEEFDSEEEFVDNDSEAESVEGEEEDQPLFGSDDEAVIDSESDAGSLDLEADDLKERDLEVPSSVSHSNNPLLQFFWKLSDENKAIRVAAVSSLVEHINLSQAAFVAPETADIPKDSKILSLYDSGALASRCCSDLTYSVKRLIKGLAASRDSSRFGFMLALLAIYSSFSSLLDSEVIITWTMKLTSPEALGGSVKRRDERLLYVARIFALGALFRSGLGASLSAASKQSAIDALVAVGKKKSFLRESTLEVLTCIAQSSDSSVITYAFKKMALLPIFNIETLSFAILMTSRFNISLSELERKELPQFLSEFTDLKTILSSANIEPLLNLLQDAPCFENRLHLIWSLVLGSLNEGGFMSSADFVKRIVDEMFLNSTGLNKRWTGLLLLKQIIDKSDAGSIGFIFSPVVLRMIKGALGTLNVKSSAVAGKEVTAFNQTVLQIFRDLIVKALEGQDKMSSGLAIDFILNLSKINTSGKNLLEELSGDNSIVTKLYSRLSTSDVISIIDSIAQNIDLTMDLENGSLIAFQAPFDRLIALVKNDILVKLEKSSEWIDYIVLIFARICLLPNSLNEELKEVVKGRFYALLNELSDVKRFAGINWINRVSELFLNSTASSKSSTAGFTVNVDEPTSDALKNLKIVEKQLLKQKIEPERLNCAISILQKYLIILVFLDPIEAIPVSSELSECIESNFAKDSKKTKTNNNINLEAVITVLVDILMSFLAKPSQLTRKMCDDVFRNIIPYLSLDSLNVLFQILKSRDTEKTDIFDEVDDTMSADSDSDSEDEEIEEEECVGADFDEAMKSSKSQSEESNELSDVDDDHMMAFDDKLAEIFRKKRKQLASSASNSKSQQKESKKTVTQFKFKVLDLLNFAFKSGDLPVSVRIASIESLLEVVSANVMQNNSSAEQKQFLSKLESFFSDSFTRSGRNVTAVDAKTIETLIGSLIERICSGDKLLNHAAVLPRVAQSIWFGVKLCRNIKYDESKIKSKFVDLIKYSVSAEEDRFRVLRSFVFTWANWDLQYILPVLVTLSTELKALMTVGAIRSYQRNQLFEFLTSALKRAQSFNEKDSALALLNLIATLFTETYSSVLSDTLKNMKVEFFRDDLKFIQFCYKKHRELNAKEYSASWEAVITVGLTSMEELWKAQANPSNSVKSFLGQIKSFKQQ